MIYISDSVDNEFGKVVIKLSSPVEYRIPFLPNGIYFLNVFFESDKENLFYGYIYNRNISFSVVNGLIYFAHSKVFDKNKVFYAKLKTTQQQLSLYLRPSKDIQSECQEIKYLSRLITRGCLNSYQKLLSIHDWVAENIYYDMDSLRSGKYVKMDNSALNTLNMKKSVCQGYSNLSVALFRAAGIPSVGMLCFSLGLSSNGGWEVQENMAAEANHVVTFAYADYRWVIMDITWDSDNIFENEGYHKKKQIGVSHKYFDTTLAFISNTHRFTDEWLK